MQQVNLGMIGGGIVGSGVIFVLIELLGGTTKIVMVNVK
jgi:hypothetical protein